MSGTHEVFNQPHPLVGGNLFDSHAALKDALRLNAPGLDLAPLSELGALLGSAHMQAHARLANVHQPVLRSHDAQGRRMDEVEFHPSYHALMTEAVAAGLHGTPWYSGLPHAHQLRAAGFMLFTELEPSVLCPISMTYAVTPALAGNPALAAGLGPRLASRQYDARLVPWPLKAGLTMGMGMTEKQGGSDVRANTSTALAIPELGHRREQAGHGNFMRLIGVVYGPGQAHGQGGGGLGFECQIGQHVLHQGLGDQRFAKSLALARVVQGQAERLAHQAAGA